MADTLVEGSAAPGLASLSVAGELGPYWISTTTGAVVYITSSADVCAKVTTDGGASWGSQVIAEAGTAAAIGAWFDRQTPGDTGTLIHVVWGDSVDQDFTYAAFDVNAGTWGSAVDINATVGTTPGYLFVTKTRSGNLIAGFNTVVGNEAWKSTDSGASWSSITTAYEGTARDAAIGIVCDTGDTDDAAIVYWDVSAAEISIKVYDNSGNSWSETSVATPMSSSTSLRQWGAKTRFSDGHTILAAWSQADNAASDLKVFDLTVTSSPSVSTLTDVITDTAEAVCAGVFVDPNAHDIYVAYAIGTSYQSQLHVSYKKSTDGGSTWGGETTYSEDAEDDIRGVYGGACGTAGGRFQPLYFNDDLSDLFVNLTNDIEIAAAGGGDPEGSLIRGKLIRGGLLRGGVLVG